MKTLRLAAAALLSAAIAVPAAAVPLTFELTGSRMASFTLDSNPVPDAATSSTLVGDQIIFNNVPGTFGGVQGTASTINFGTGLIAALNILSPDLGFTQFSGPDLFTGGADSPMFLTGTFQLNSLVAGSSTLVISEAPADVPAPAALGLLALGAGIMAVSRKRMQKAGITARG